MAEGRRSLTLPLVIRPAERKQMNVLVLDDFAEMQLHRITPLSGAWLPPPNGLLVERASLIEGREMDWQVVGIVQGVLTGGIGYANQEFLARELRFIGRSGWTLVFSDRDDGASQKDLARRLKEQFDAAGMRFAATSTTAEIRETIEFQFNIIVILLAIMAILIALVGDLGLMGTMSINVLERTREIGVMRAVGASDGSILCIVLVEGVLIGIISWVIGGIIAYPMGRLLSNIVGTELLQSSLTYHFALTGAVGWLAAVLLIASLASFFTGVECFPPERTADTRLRINQ